MAKKVTPKKKVTPVSHHISYLYEDAVMTHTEQISDLFGKVAKLTSMDEFTRSRGEMFDLLTRVRYLESAMDEAHEKIWSKVTVEEFPAGGIIAAFDVSGSTNRNMFLRWAEDAKTRRVTHFFAFTDRVGHLCHFTDAAIDRESLETLRAPFGGKLGTSIRCAVNCFYPYAHLYIYTDGEDSDRPIRLPPHVSMLVNL